MSSPKTILYLSVLIFSCIAIPIRLKLTLTCPCRCTHFHGSAIMMEADSHKDDVLSTEKKDFSAEYGSNVATVIVMGEETDDGPWDPIIEPYLKVTHNCWGTIKTEDVHFPQCNTRRWPYCYHVKNVTLSHS